MIIQHRYLEGSVVDKANNVGFFSICSCKLSKLTWCELLFGPLCIQNLLNVVLAGGFVTKVLLTLDVKGYYK